MTPDSNYPSQRRIATQVPDSGNRKWRARGEGSRIVIDKLPAYAAVICISCSQTSARHPICWADHGYNRQATYSTTNGEKLLKLTTRATSPSHSGPL